MMARASASVIVGGGSTDAGAGIGAGAEAAKAPDAATQNANANSSNNREVFIISILARKAANCAPSHGVRKAIAQAQPRRSWHRSYAVIHCASMILRQWGSVYDRRYQNGVA